MTPKFSDMKYERVEINPVPEELIKLVAEVKNPESAEQMIESYRKVDEWLGHLDTMYSLGYVRYTINTADEFYSAERDYYDEYMPAVEELIASMGLAVARSPYRGEMEKLVGEVALRNMELSAKAISPEIVEDLAAENALASDYQKLTASARIDFDGKVLTLSQLVPYKTSADRSVREAAFRAEGEYFESIGDQLDDIFDRMVKLRTAMAHKLGFESFTEMGYCRRTRNCYTREDVKAFRDQVAESVVPKVSELLEAQYERTGVSDPKFWDRGFEFKTGNPAPKDSPEVIFENGKKMYSELSKQTGEFMDFMLDRELFDVLSKENKATGGYCIGLFDFKAPFVFANFNGTKDDIEVLTHECGHALEDFVALRLYDISDKMKYTYDIAEIHSMSMEFFTYPWMKLFFKEDTEKFYFSHLFGNLQFWPYGCMVDHFQHSVYDNPDWTSEQRHAEWKRLEGIYRPDADFSDLPYYSKGGMWQRQLHIYLDPFYYIDYCLAQYAAVCFFNMMNEDREKAWNSYFELIKKAGTRDYLQLLEEAGIGSPFDGNSIVEVADKAYKYLLSIKNSVK